MFWCLKYRFSPGTGLDTFLYWSTLFLSAHFSSLWRFLWIEAQSSATLATPFNLSHQHTGGAPCPTIQIVNKDNENYWAQHWPLHNWLPPSRLSHPESFCRTSLSNQPTLHQLLDEYLMGDSIRRLKSTYFVCWSPFFIISFCSYLIFSSFLMLATS